MRREMASSPAAPPPSATRPRSNYYPGMPAYSYSVYSTQKGARTIRPELNFTAQSTVLPAGVSGIWGDPANLGNGYVYVANNPASSVDPLGLQGPVKFIAPIGQPRPILDFRFKASDVVGGVSNVIISSRDALALKPGTPVHTVLRRCTVIIVTGQGRMIGKKG